MDFKPGGWRGDPMFYRHRGARTGKFGLDGPRESNPFKHAGKNLDMADQDQVIDRAGIGDDQLLGLESELL